MKKSVDLTRPNQDLTRPNQISQSAYVLHLTNYPYIAPPKGGLRGRLGGITAQDKRIESEAPNQKYGYVLIASGSTQTNGTVAYGIRRGNQSHALDALRCLLPYAWRSTRKEPHV